MFNCMKTIQYYQHNLQIERGIIFHYHIRDSYELSHF